MPKNYPFYLFFCYVKKIVNNKSTLLKSLQESQYDDSTLTANEADEEDEVDENMPSTSHHNNQHHHSSSHIKRLRKGCMLLKNSESHTTDDSIDDSDGSGITTMTSMTVTGAGTSDQKTDSLAAKRQQFRNYHRNKHVQHHTHARYKTNVSQTKDHSHVASGLKLAQSQAMAVAGFLPVDSSTEKHPNDDSSNRSQTNKNFSCSNLNHSNNKQQAKASKSHEFHSVGSESMAGTDTTSLDAATDAQSLHTIASINQPGL